jgi:hypothetical protein
VLLVPSNVINFDNQNNQINGHWMDLQSIFEQADQHIQSGNPNESFDGACSTI